MPKPKLELVLTPHGSAELRRGDDVEWSSDDDDDFKDRNADEFLGEDDVPEILSYLVETEVLTEYQAFEIETHNTYVETLNEGELDEDDEDEDDEDEEID
jgi:hypothetical protein